MKNQLLTIAILFSGSISVLSQTIDIYRYQEIPNPYGGITVPYIPSNGKKESSKKAKTARMFTLEEIVNIFEHPRNLEVVLVENSDWNEIESHKIGDSIWVYPFQHITNTMSVNVQNRLLPTGKMKLQRFSQMVSKNNSQIKGRKEYLIQNGWNVMETLEFPGWPKEILFVKGDLCISIQVSDDSWIEGITSKNIAEVGIQNVKKAFSK